MFDTLHMHASSDTCYVQLCMTPSCTWSHVWNASLRWTITCRYVAEADPEEIEGEAPQLVPLTDGTVDKQPITASEGTPLLSDRADEGAHQLVGDASGSDPSVERGEISTLDGEDFVDLGSNEIIKELEPER